MEAYDCLLNRRSVREFGEGKISDDSVTRIITAAMYAPSAGNQRPWHFVVIRDKAALERIMEFHPHAGMLRSACLAIAVVADTAGEKYPGYWVVDCSAATENLLLAIHAEGLGGCWLGIYPREERSKELALLLGLPPEVRPHSLVAVGVPSSPYPRPERFDPGKIHNEKW